MWDSASVRRGRSSQMKPTHDGAAKVVRWMLSEGRRNTHMREFGDEMCRRIVAAGIPIWRAFCFVGTLHPQIAATAYIWSREASGATRITAGHGLVSSPEFTESPIAAARKLGRVIRRRLIDPACPADFPVLHQYREEGGTDYIAIPMILSDGNSNAITFMSDRAEGFTDAQAAGLEDVAEALGVIVELQSSRRIAKSLLDTYIGRRTGQRVLSGVITRGSGENIRAVIWCCDLRGFTGLADRLPRVELTTLLNEYFEIMAGAVLAAGGEVLKFIGDGMLAIFELREGEDAGDRCAAALKAARAAVTAIAERNLKRAEAGSPEIRFGLALHLGDLYYGNIGAPDRLDFTVIGPAVNHAARLEKLGSDLGRRVVASASFAAAAPERLESLGHHRLRGVVEPQELFALRD
jgi:adenylate cyclase